MPVVSNDFSDIVYNRRSIRNFDPSVKIPREELLEILDKTVTAPSRTFKDLSTSTVKSTCPGVSIMLIL